MTAKAKGLLWVAIAIAVAGAVAIGLPTMAKHVPWPVERLMGNIFGGSAVSNACRGRSHPEAPALFGKLVRRLYPLVPGDSELPITIDVVPGKTVNAYATLGGHIYVFDGLLKKAQSPDELAGVLAHEIEHVRNRHVIQGVAVNVFTLSALKVVLPGDHPTESYIAYLLLTLKFSRQQEYEADLAGLERLRAARVDAAGFQQFFERAAKMSAPPAIISNHPSNEQRKELAARFKGYPVEPLLDSKEWEAVKIICD
ncbi:MAG: M48 family metallopeptidase [Betaproteobacteria bacterium]